MANRPYDEDLPRVAAKRGHILGETLDDLSVRDFDERIALLRAEIERLEAARRVKQAAHDHADALFGPGRTKTGQA